MEPFRKLKTTKTAGCIEDHFEVLGKNYVRVREDKKSNYLPISSIYFRDITNPREKLLVDLVSEILYNRL